MFVSDTFSNLNLELVSEVVSLRIRPSITPALVHGVLMAFSSYNRSEDRELSSNTQGKTHYLRTAIVNPLSIILPRVPFKEMDLPLAS